LLSFPGRLRLPAFPQNLFAGVSFRSATEPFDTGTAAGRMIVQMLGVFAEFDHATLIDRVIAGMEASGSAGKLHMAIASIEKRRSWSQTKQRLPLRA
jgi:DNA invertase Pin-like site-specific DNA recombinase